MAVSFRSNGGSTNYSPGRRAFRNRSYRLVEKVVNRAFRSPSRWHRDSIWLL